MNIVTISNILFGETLRIYSSIADKQALYIILLIKNSCTGPVHALGLLYYFVQGGGPVTGLIGNYWAHKKLFELRHWVHTKLFELR